MQVESECIHGGAAVKQSVSSNLLTMICTDISIELVRVVGWETVTVTAPGHCSGGRWLWLWGFLGTVSNRSCPARTGLRSDEMIYDLEVIRKGVTQRPFEV